MGYPAVGDQDVSAPLVAATDASLRCVFPPMIPKLPPM